MRRLMIGLLLLAATTAPPLSGSAQAVQDRDPDWLRQPTAEDIESIYPRAAVRKGSDGNARISCIVTVDGGLRDCRIEKETPAGLGFGQAALTLVQQFGMRPAIRNGKVVEERVNIPVGFIGAGTRTGSHIPGDTTQGMQRVARNVPWLKAPTFAQMTQAFPSRAKERNLVGRATLSCTFRSDGGLNACFVTNEDPIGLGFGAAAKTLVEEFQAQPTTPEGQSLNRASVQIPFTFNQPMMQGGQPATINAPKWAAMPTNADFGAAFPSKARGADIERSRVVLLCVVASGGGLEGCRVTTETPAGLGFGEAALSLSTKFRLNAWTEDGLPTAGSAIRLPIAYEIKGGGPSAAPQG